MIETKQEMIDLGLHWIVARALDTKRRTIHTAADVDKYGNPLTYVVERIHDGWLLTVHRNHESAYHGPFETEDKALQRAEHLAIGWSSTYQEALERLYRVEDVAEDGIFDYRVQNAIDREMGNDVLKHRGTSDHPEMREAIKAYGGKMGTSLGTEVWYNLAPRHAYWKRMVPGYGD